MVSNNGLRNSGTNSIDLRSNTTTFDSDTNIEVAELVLTDDQNWFEDLQTKCLRLNILNGLAINLDKATSLFCESNSSSCFFPNIQKDEKRERILIQNNSEVRAARIPTPCRCPQIIVAEVSSRIMRKSIQQLTFRKLGPIVLLAW